MGYKTNLDCQSFLNQLELDNSTIFEEVGRINVKRKCEILKRIHFRNENIYALLRKRSNMYSKHKLSPT